jgi:wyosine [tRNA(Phe)-imidazoG37] synthetase (radical SAM superfamily)
MTIPQTVMDPIVFGPVPSRRLGRSLGINNIPPKICSYSCVYCQVGRTLKMRSDRSTLNSPDYVIAQVENRVRQLRAQGESIDFLTFVSDGEPTLDENLGQEIRGLRHLGIKIAVITNASLISRMSVRKDLSHADWVSLKVDAVDPRIWHRINRPLGTLDLNHILQGMRIFARNFPGELVTETMLIHEVNDSAEHIRRVASYLEELAPRKSYLAIPTRPPTEPFVHIPTDAALNRAYLLLQERSISIECILGYEGNAFASSGNAAEDLLSITAVHPMKKEAVVDLLASTGTDWSLVTELLANGQLVETRYQDDYFYLRNPRLFS